MNPIHTWYKYIEYASDIVSGRCFRNRKRFPGEVKNLYILKKAECFRNRKRKCFRNRKLTLIFPAPLNSPLKPSGWLCRKIAASSREELTIISVMTLMRRGGKYSNFNNLSVKKHYKFHPIHFRGRFFKKWDERLSKPDVFYHCRSILDQFRHAFGISILAPFLER
jgi:hypothetical protein